MGHLHNSLAGESTAMPPRPRAAEGWIETMAVRTDHQEQNVKRFMQLAASMAFVTSLGLSSPHVARSQTPAPRDGQHDFDFNIGVWHTHISRIRDPFADQTDSVVLNGT